MKILFITHFFPYPPNCGGRIGYLNPIKYLSRRHEVILASLGVESDRTYVHEMKKYCAGVHLFTIPHWRRAVRLVRGLVADPPGGAARFFDIRFGELIQECIRRYDVDIAEFQHLNMASYFRFAGKTPAILREHNVESAVWERHAGCASKPFERLYITACARRIRAYEARMASRFSRCIMVSRADAELLRAIAPAASVEWIPSGVDTEYFFPLDLPKDPLSMVITGSFEWRPKQHNLRVLLEHIFPRIRERIPETTLTVVGAGVPEELRRLGQGIAGVRFTGEVEDVREYIARASLVLNYVESGGGIALKVLEALALRKPVLSNTLGVEGIDLRHGQEVFVSDDVENFADAAASLLRDSEMRKRLASTGYDTIRHRYSWSSLVPRFEEIYDAVVAESKCPPPLPLGLETNLRDTAPIGPRL